MLEPHLAEKNHQEEAKLQHPKSPSLYKASPCHITLRKLEGCYITRWRLQTCLRDADQQTRDRNSTKWNDRKVKKGWKPFSLPK
jgi:hypothetical protein